LKKRIEEDIGRWKDLPCSWINRINIVKMVTLLRVIHRLKQFLSIFNVILYRNAKISPKTYLNSQSNTEQKKKAMLEVSQYLTANYTRIILTKTAWYWHKTDV
jgi:hypothetical protein